MRRVTIGAEELIAGNSETTLCYGIFISFAAFLKGLENNKEILSLRIVSAAAATFQHHVPLVGISVLRRTRSPVRLMANH